jgi:hypothetical protein
MVSLWFIDGRLENEKDDEWLNTIPTMAIYCLKFCMMVMGG